MPSMNTRSQDCQKPVTAYGPDSAQLDRKPATQRPSLLEQDAGRSAGIRRVGEIASALKCAAASRNLEFMRSSKYASRIGRPGGADVDSPVAGGTSPARSRISRDTSSSPSNVSPMIHVSGSPAPRRMISAQQVGSVATTGCKRQHRWRQARQGMAGGTGAVERLDGRCDALLGVSDPGPHMLSQAACACGDRPLRPRRSLDEPEQLRERTSPPRLN